MIAAALSAAFAGGGGGGGGSSETSLLGVRVPVTMRSSDAIPADSRSRPGRSLPEG